MPNSLCCTRSCPDRCDPAGQWGAWLAPTLIGAAALTAAIILLLVGLPLLAGLALIAGGVGAALKLREQTPPTAIPSSLTIGPDYSLVGSALGLSRDPVALTEGDGSLLVVNSAYRDSFGDTSPMQLAAEDEQAAQGLALAQSMAWRDGAGCVAGIATSAGVYPVEVERVGAVGDLLLWRFPSAAAA